MKFYRSLPQIKAMTFDLDDTLYDNRPVIADLESKLLAWLAPRYPEVVNVDRAWWLEQKHLVAERNPDLKHDVTRWRHEQLQCGLSLLGYSQENSLHAADLAIEEVLRLRNQIDVPRETHRVLTELAAKIPLVAITNGNADPSRIGLADYFELVLQAGPDGRAKPYPDMFDVAQSHLNVPSHHILHVGDHPKTDVFGAWQNGYSSCWFNDQNITLFESSKAKILPNIEIAQLADLISLV